MGIVLKENEWAADAVQTRTLGKKPSETLRRVARYYLDAGYTKREVRRFLDTFLIRCEPSFSLPKWSDALDTALSKAIKYKAVDIDSIDISEPEMNRIDALRGKQLKRLAFTLLCLAKYWQVVIPQGDCWVNNKDSDIMTMANISASLKRQGALYGQLQAEGLVAFSKRVDNTHVKVCFLQEGKTVLHITDFRNLGYQYLKYHGAPYFECENCGIITRIDNPDGAGRKQKYCKECAAVVQTRQKVNAVMRRRTKA